MPKKIVINNSGSYQEIAASLQIDDNGALSSSYLLTLNTASYPGNSGLMQVFRGQLKPVGISNINDEPGVNYSGSVLSYNSNQGFGPHRTEAASFSGDLSGDLVNGVKVRSVSNVTGGLLSTAYGGIGTGSVTTGGVLFSSGSKPVYGPSNQILAVTGSSGQVNLVSSSILPFTPMTGTLVYLYTGSVGTDKTYIWTKPNGCRFIRVICQGGGGGGASGKYGITNPLGGAGGSGGGFSDSVFNASNITGSITITVGRGGAGGVGNSVNGNVGGSSLFGNYLSALGGSSAAIGAIAIGGVGYIRNGASGGASQSGGGGNITSGLGAPGGGGGGGNGSSVDDGGVGGSPFNGSGAAPGGYGNNGNNALSYSFFNFSSYYLNTTSSITIGNFPKISCSGGSGGGASLWSGGSVGGNGGSGLFGSGGGGGGCKISTFSGTTTGAGGAGGAGYVLIICY